MPGPGSHPPAELAIHGKFKELMGELLGPQFRSAIERKFAIDLTGRPTMYTVRGFVRDRILPDVAEWFEQGILPRELALRWLQWRWR